MIVLFRFGGIGCSGCGRIRCLWIGLWVIGGEVRLAALIVYVTPCSLCFVLSMVP